MYRYDEFDHAFVRERVEQFRDQVDRRLAGQLNEEEFRPLRLRNGLYLQLHAYMLRIAIPYGVLSPKQLRQRQRRETGPAGDSDCDLDYVPRVARPARVLYALANFIGFVSKNSALVFGNVQ